MGKKSVCVCVCVSFFDRQMRKTNYKPSSVLVFLFMYLKGMDPKCHKGIFNNSSFNNIAYIKSFALGNVQPFQNSFRTSENRLSYLLDSQTQSIIIGNHLIVAPKILNA